MSHVHPYDRACAFFPVERKDTNFSRSVNLQVGYFKLTHGKRIFRMAPLHHHLELGGWSEVRIVLTFTGITVAFCLLAFVGVMYRYSI